MKLAAEAYKTIEIALFLFCSPSLGHLPHKNPIYAVELTFHFFFF